MAGTEIVANRAQVCLQFMDKLNDVFGSSHFCDLIFELRGHQFFAHRAVLAAWSPLVYGIFSKEKCMIEKIRLNYDNIEAFGSFVSFLYSGQLNSDAEGHLIQVLHLATSLQVNILRQTCEEALKRQLHIGNIISTFHVARKFRLPNLEEYALNFMQMNLPEAVKQTDFLSLSPPRFNSFLSSGWVCVMKPEVKLFLIISWLGYDVKERQQYLVLLLRYIDWSTVANDFLLEISQTENFFTTNESSLYLLLQTLFSSTIPLGPYTDLFPGLREKYGFLLDHIIHNSYMLPVEPEEYFPVSFQLATILPSSSPDSGYQVKKSSKTRGPGPSFISGVNENNNASNVGQSVGDCVISEERCEKEDKNLETYNLASLGCTLEEPQLLGSLPKDFIKLPAVCKKESAVASMVKRRGRPRRAVAAAKTCSDLARLAALSTKITYQKIRAEANSIPLEIKIKTTRRARKETDERAKNQTDSKVVGLDPDDGIPGKQSKRKASSRFAVPEKLIPLKRAVRRKNIPRKMASDNTKSSDNEQLDTSSVDGSTAEKSPRKMAENELLCHNEEADSGEHSQFEKLMNKVPVGAQIPAAKRTSSATLTNQKQTFLTEHVQLEQSTSSHKDLLAFSLPAEESMPQEQKRTSPHLPDSVKKCEEHGSSASCSAVSVGPQKPARVKQGTMFSCTVCSFECFRRMAFYSHMRQHFPGPPHVCDHEGCGYAASKIQPFLIHRRKHTDERPYKCTHCGALFRNSNNLYAHLKCHSEDKKFECPVCKRRFRMKNTMEQHMVIHSDDRPYLCDTCGFSTKYQSHLIAHKRIHTGEVFHCGFPMCKYYSPKRSQLKAHMRSHLNVRHFACEICQKSFVEKSHLVRHRRIHQEDRPFRCEKCDYSSTRMDKLREHVERHHGDNPTVKRKFTPRKKKGTSSSSIPTASTTTGTSSSSIKMVSSALPKENHWGQNVEASIATLVSAAEEVQLASEIRENTGQVYDRASGQELVPHHSLAANCENKAQTDGYGLQERVVGRIEYTSDSLGQTVGTATGSSSQGIENGIRSMHSTESSGKSVAVSSTQLSYEGLHPKQFHHMHPNNHQNLTHPPQHVSLHIQHQAPTSLLQQPQRAAHLQHTSASLLQQLAMSVGAASGNEQVSLSSSVVSNTNPIVLAHSISADMPVAPHILLSAIPQHATPSAADSLASLSHGLTLSLLSTQSGVNAAGLQQAFQSSGLPVTPAQLTLRQQEHHHQQQQPPPTHSSQQNPDFGGLNAFMALL